MANPSGITPIGSRILVSPLSQDETTPVGIIVTTQRPRNKGIVVDVGEDVKSVCFNDKVLFLTVIHVEKDRDGNEYFIVDEKDVAAILI